MKKIILLAMFVFSFLGCTTYNSEIRNNSYSPVASTQVLRNIPLLQTSKNILFFNKQNINNVGELFKSRTSDKYFCLKNTDVSKEYIESSTIDSFLENKNLIFTEPIYLSFRYMQDLINVSGGTESFDVSENKTTVTKDSANLKYNNERRIFFKEEITTRLLLEGMRLTDDLNKARLIMNVTIYEDGLMDKFKFGFFYLYSKTSGVIGLNVEIIDLKQKKIILSYFIKNRSIYKDLRILYFIPKIEMTEDLEFEY